MDAPAILSRTDAAAIGRATDGAILVVASQTDRSIDVQRALDLLEAGAVPVTGAILNDSGQRPARALVRRSKAGR